MLLEDFFESVLFCFFFLYLYCSATRQEKLLLLPHAIPTAHGQSKSELSFSVSGGMKWKVNLVLTLKIFTLPQSKELVI